MSRLWSALALLILVGLALGLRVWGNGSGLPYPYHPDEPAHILQALAIARGLPDGLTFHNPPLFKYLLLADYSAVYGLGQLGGLYLSPAHFIDQFRADPTLLYLVGRTTSAALGALTVPAVFALATMARGRVAAWLAAWLTAVAYLLTRQAHFAVNDTLVTLLVTLALIGSVRIAGGAGTRTYLVTGALTGLAFAAKYQGAVALLPLVLAHGLRPNRRRRDLLATFGAAGATTLVAFPSLLFEPGRVINDVYVHLYLRGLTGYDGLDPAGGYLYYLKVLVWGLGWPVALAAVAGLVWAVIRRDRVLITIAALPLALYIFLGYQHMFFARFLLPAVPALIVLAAVAIADGLRGIAGRLRFPTGSLRPRYQYAAVITAAALIGLPTSLNSVSFNLISSRTDTRTEAGQWMATHLPAGTRLAIDDFPFGPPLPAGHRDALVARGWWLFERDLDDYQSEGINYLVVSSYTSDLRLVEPERDRQRRRFYERLGREAGVVAEFRPGDPVPDFVYERIYAPFDQLDRFERPGPTITIYRLTPDPSGPRRKSGHTVKGRATN